MRTTLLSAVALTVTLTGCGDPNRKTTHGVNACGLLACISSPYLKAKFSPLMIGRHISEAIALAGSPTSSYKDGAGEEYLTWRRTQEYGGGILACQELLQVRGTMIVDYRYDGHC